MSAKTLDRPSIRRLMAMLDSGKADGLLVAKLDRLTAGSGIWSAPDRAVLQREGEVSATTLLYGDSIDTRSATGRMVLNMIMTIAMEGEIIAERTRRPGHQGQLGRAVRAGAVRLGPRLEGPDEPDNREAKTAMPSRLRANPSEQLVIWIIRRLAAEGYRARAIATYLNERGIPTKLGKGPWIHTAVARILKRVS